MWVTSFKGSSFSKVFPAVGYGVLSDYQRLAAGTYTVAMRSPGRRQRQRAVAAHQRHRRARGRVHRRWRRPER